MNNHGIADDSTTPTSPPADFDSTGHNLSGQTLTAAGYAPATAVTVDNGDAYQATFTMPATNDTTATPDNIITDGQTIPLPDKPTNRVDLLVAATCGTTTYQTGNTLMNFKVNYTNGAKHPITNSLVFALPAVPDWLDGNLADASTAAQPTADGYVYPNGQYISPAATLAYQDAGTEPQTASPVAQPHLYHISLPFSLPGGYYAASLTLPDTGTTFTDGTTCGVAPALHILAIDDTNQPADQAPAINQTPSIAAGQDHTIAVQTGGTVWAWGNNTDGQLGNGTTTANPTPVQVLTANGQALTDVVSVAAGGQDSMALDNNGDVWEWGDNTDGQLGNGGIYTNDPYANQVLTGPGTPLTNVAAIAAGQYHSLAVQTNGTVWAWGSNSNGQLGDGQAGTNNSSYATPVDLPTGITITQVAAGYADSFALTNAGNLYAWGQNSSGQLGDGQNTDADLPTLITTTNTDAALPPLIAVTAHQYHVTALDTTGNVWAWGDNTDGQLGNGTIGGNTNQPTQVDSLSGVASIAVSSGGTDSIALESNGTVWDWGNGNNGALGNATTGTDSPTPVQVDLPANTNIVAITGGIDYTMALQNNGTLWGWGADQYGQIGDGTSGAGNNQDTPIQSQYTQQTTTG